MIIGCLGRGSVSQPSLVRGRMAVSCPVPRQQRIGLQSPTKNIESFRECRRMLGMSQRHFASVLGLDVETCRVLDSGRREVPAAILARVRILADQQAARETSVATHAGRRTPEPALPLPELARLVGIHVRTLLAAARDGYLPVMYDTRTTFRNLRRRSTLSTARHYKRGVLLP